MLQLDFKSGTPIYDQIVLKVIKLKMLGALKAGDALPSVRALASKLGINPNTVMRAYAILEEKGVIYSVTGKGSFISGESDKSYLNDIVLKDFIKAVKDAKQMGKTAEELKNEIDRLFLEG